MTAARAIAAKGNYNRCRKAEVNQFGVPLGEIRKLAQEIKANHELAITLWETGNIDARLLVILLSKPKNLSGDELVRMVRSLNLVQVADWLPAILDRLESEIGDASREVQGTRNFCRAGIGVHFPQPRQRAIALGETLGIDRDDPVSQGDASPLAPTWIREMAPRQG